MPTQVYLNKAGDKVPGVTTVIGNLGWKGEGLLYWANKLGLEGKTLQSERKKDADAGSLTHLMVSCEILGLPAPDLADYTQETVITATACHASYRAWRERNLLKLVASEVPLVSERHQYGGCPDAIGVSLAPGRVLLDWKSAKDLYPETIIQVAAYERLWNENNPDLAIDEVSVVRWRPDGAVQHDITREQLEAGWQVFLRLLDIHNLKAVVSPPKKRAKVAA